MIPSRLVLATSNAGKVRELGVMVRRWGAVEVLSLSAFPGVFLPPEDGETYAANAAMKAATVATATGLVALADDSGLEVDALGGAPGVRSARFAATDAERVEKLLGALAEIGPDRRTARFRCAVALVWPDGRLVTAEGTCVGRIARISSGRDGFGYDPIFEPDGYTASFAALPAATKDRLSHRARAMAALGHALCQG